MSRSSALANRSDSTRLVRFHLVEPVDRRALTLSGAVAAVTDSTHASVACAAASTVAVLGREKAAGLRRLFLLAHLRGGAGGGPFVEDC